MCTREKTGPFEDLTVLDALGSLFVISISLQPCLPSGNMPSTPEAQLTQSEARILIFPKFTVFEWLWGYYHPFVRVFIHSFTCLQATRASCNGYKAKYGGFQNRQIRSEPCPGL